MTICAHNHRCLFGEVINAEMCLNEVGKIVAAEWERSGEIRSEIAIDAFVVMPNHLHAIVFITELPPNSDGPRPTRALRGTERRSLSALVAGFKAATTRQVGTLRHKPTVPIWQRNYYEHIIRNDRDLDRIRQYVADNPARWSEDGYHPPKTWVE